MTDNRNTILLCLNDASLRLLLRDLLQERGFSVLHSDLTGECLSLACLKAPDICLVETMPDTDGIDLVRELRLRNVIAPIILLSERNTKEDILAAYNSGCDDYILKPFSFDILLCHIQALLRLVRRNAHNDTFVFSLGGVTFDAKRQLLGTQPLSSKENDMLLLLCRNLNRQVDRTVLLKNIWLTDDVFAARSMAVYVHRLRRYLQPIEGVRLVSVHGKGLKLIDDSAS